MAADLEEELEVTRALLRQARADRDRLQRRLLQLEHKIRFLRRVPFVTAASRARERLRSARAADTGSTTVPVAAGPVRPGRYVDVTELAHPARTGIARVVVRLTRELGYDLVAMADGRLVHDLTFYEEIHGRPAPAAVQQRAGTPLIPGPGVTVLNGAIQLRGDYPAWQGQIRALRAAGGTYVQIVHDLLPIGLPDFFDLGMRVRFPDWLAFVATHADLVLTDSAATRDDMRAWLSGQADLGQRVRERAGIEVALLGSDFHPVPTRRSPDPAQPRVLVVGTVEPRKAVDVVVTAVQQLRAGGADVQLTVVGACGWADEALVEELRSLQRKGWLQWLERADDQQLARCYADHDLLLAASRGEGYGLPVAEAMAAELPVLARDLPVFRELLGEGGRYFRLDRELAGALGSALIGPPAVPGGALRSWQEAAADVDRFLDGLSGYAVRARSDREGDHS